MIQIVPCSTSSSLTIIFNDDAIGPLATWASTGIEIDQNPVVDILVSDGRTSAFDNVAKVILNFERCPLYTSNPVADLLYTCLCRKLSYPLQKTLQ